MKISVIMPSFLSQYDGCAKNREQKFIRAVDSFIAQTYNDKELVIVADGCLKTKNLYEQLYSKNPDIKFIAAKR